MHVLFQNVPEDLYAQYKSAMYANHKTVIEGTLKLMQRYIDENLAKQSQRKGKVKRNGPTL